MVLNRTNNLSNVICNESSARYVAKTDAYRCLHFANKSYGIF